MSTKVIHPFGGGGTVEVWTGRTSTSGGAYFDVELNKIGNVVYGTAKQSAGFTLKNNSDSYGAAEVDWYNFAHEGFQPASTKTVGVTFGHYDSRVYSAKMLVYGGRYAGLFGIYIDSMHGISNGLTCDKPSDDEPFRFWYTLD